MKRRWATLLAMFVLAGVVTAPAASLASTTEAIGDTGGMTLELNLLGVPVGVVVTLDGIGHITTVDIADGDFTQDRGGLHKVRFSNTGETTRIDVRAKKDKLRADVKTAAVSDIRGTHTWRGKLFGSDTDSVVTFDVVENAAGHPELENVSVDVLFPADATADVGAVENSVESDEAESKSEIEFHWNGFEMELKIKVEAHLGDDDRPVHLRVELRGKDEQRLRRVALDEIAGSHVWEGRLCDATPVTVAYTIDESGVSFDGATLGGEATDAFELKDKGHGFELRFDDSKAKVKVEAKQKSDGSWDLKVRSKTTEKCDHHDRHGKKHGGGDDKKHGED